MLLHCSALDQLHDSSFCSKTKKKLNLQVEVDQKGLAAKHASDKARKGTRDFCKTLP